MFFWIENVFFSALHDLIDKVLYSTSNKLMQYEIDILKRRQLGILMFIPYYDKKPTAKLIYFQQTFYSVNFLNTYPIAMSHLNSCFRSKSGCKIFDGGRFCNPFKELLVMLVKKQLDKRWGSTYMIDLPCFPR